MSRARFMYLPEAGQGQPSGQKPGHAGEASIQIPVVLGNRLVHHATDLLPWDTAGKTVFMVSVWNYILFALKQVLQTLVSFMKFSLDDIQLD